MLWWPNLWGNRSVGCTLPEHKLPSRLLNNFALEKKKVMASTVRDNFIDATKVEQMLAQLSAIADELTEIPGMLTKSSFYKFSLKIAKRYFRQKAGRLEDFRLPRHHQGSWQAIQSSQKDVRNEKKSDVRSPFVHATGAKPGRLIFLAAPLLSRSKFDLKQSALFDSVVGLYKLLPSKPPNSSFLLAIEEF